MLKITHVAKKNQYFEIQVQNNLYDIDEFYYQILLPYVGKELNQQKVDELVAFANAKEILKKFYSKISHHLISEYGFRQKLLFYHLSYDDIDKIVNCLKEEHYFTEKDFIEVYQNLYMKDKGIHAFKTFLKQNKISDEQIQIAIQSYIENEEFLKNYVLKYSQSHISSTVQLKQKLYYQLLNKGFSTALIERVLENFHYQYESESLKKEIKIYLRKYEQDSYKVISKLVNKGYNIADIKKYLQEIKEED